MVCNLCGVTYIGETSRPLVTRFQEHYRSTANPTAKSYKNMAFSKHYRDQHPGLKPKLSVKILKKTKGSLQRKITEALYIQELKPDLNGKYEQLNIFVKDRTLNAVKFTQPSRNKLDKTHQQRTHRLFVASSCMANVYLPKTVHKNYNKMTITSN